MQGTLPEDPSQGVLADWFGHRGRAGILYCITGPSVEGTRSLTQAQQERRGVERSS
jgi:hypothetical protein